MKTVFRTLSLSAILVALASCGSRPAATTTGPSYVDPGIMMGSGK